LALALACFFGVGEREKEDETLSELSDLSESEETSMTFFLIRGIFFIVLHSFKNGFKTF
jgi:hypothetical protein